MKGLFTKIIAGEIPSYRIAEDDQFYAFLDIYPLVRGHVLVIPKLEVDRFFDLPDSFHRDWLLFAKPIAKAIESAFDCNRCGLAVLGLDVPHAHMHLLPINEANDLNFSRAKLSLRPDELEEVQSRILRAIEAGKNL